MKKNDYRLKGHESFILREGWITKGLRAVHGNKNTFSNANNYGTDTLGVGTNMAKSIRYWMKAMKLTDDTPKGVVLTALGELIYKYDTYIEDIFTLWLLHVNLTSNFQQATSWNVFFNDFTLSSFSREEMITLMTELLSIRTGDDNLSERSIKDDCVAIVQMYAETDEKNYDPEDKKVSPFAELGLLKVEKNMYEKTRPAVTDVCPELILYIIKETLESNGSILIDDLVEKDNMPGKLLNLNRVILNDYLDQLQNKKYIIVNRTAGLDVIYPGEELDVMFMIENYYGGRMNE